MYTCTRCTGVRNLVLTSSSMKTKSYTSLTYFKKASGLFFGYFFCSINTNMRRIQVPGHYNPTKTGYSEVVVSSHCRKHKLRVIVDNNKDSDSIVSITDFKTGLHEKFIFDPNTELINGTILNHTVYIMLQDYLKSQDLIMTRYKTEIITLTREYPNAREVDRHEIAISLLKSIYA